jgi:hypothetical protein
VSDTPSAEEAAVNAAKADLEAKQTTLAATKKAKLEAAQKEVDREVKELKDAQDKLKKEKG